jgi:hypothetical protein
LRDDQISATMLPKERQASPDVYVLIQGALDDFAPGGFQGFYGFCELFAQFGFEAYRDFLAHAHSV